MKLLDARELAMQFNTAGLSFDLVGNNGRKRCTWLDPALGLFIPEGAVGFSTLREFLEEGLWIENFQLKKDETTVPLPGIDHAA